MKITTALNHETRFYNRVMEAISPRFSHAEALDFMTKHVYSTDEYKRCPEWVRSRIQGAFKSRVDTCHRFGALLWCLHEDNNGTKYHDWDELPETIKEQFRTDKNKSGFHYWVETGKHF